MEALCGLISKEEACGLIKGFRIGDEVYPFCSSSLWTEAGKFQILRGMLLLFEALFGLKINLSKSKLTA